MSNRGLSRERVERLIKTYHENRGPERSWRAAAKACGYTDGKSLQKVLRRYAPLYGLAYDTSRPYDSMSSMERLRVEAEVAGKVTQPAAEALYEQPPFQVSPIPDSDLPIEQIVAMRKAEFAQKQRHEEARKLIEVKIGLAGPIGLLHFGDPHVDDDGTDIATLERHSDLTRKTEGLFGCNVGDNTNNWVGRLARLYAQQNMGRERAVKLAEWFLRRTVWLYLIAGNHDLFKGETDDPVRWIARQIDALYQASEVRVGLNFPNGLGYVINARHDFDGSSQYNPAHGPMKAIWFGVRDDLAVCGHRHISGYGVIKDPETSKVCHALRVASYKVYDRYARDKGFKDQALGPAAVTVIDPALGLAHPDLTKVFWDPEEGADYLTFKRKRISAQAKPTANKRGKK